MGKKFIIQPYGSITVDLVKNKIKVISVESKLENKLKKKCPDKIIGNAVDYLDDKKLSKLLTTIFQGEGGQASKIQNSH